MWEMTIRLWIKIHWYKMIQSVQNDIINENTLMVSRKILLHESVRIYVWYFFIVYNISIVACVVHCVAYMYTLI